MTNKLTEVTKLRLVKEDARYQLAVVSNISEADCLHQIELAEQAEEMLPLTIIVMGGYKGDKIEDLEGNVYKYAVSFNDEGEMFE